mmetsp:Transcript_104153/g.300178  ORF Transcript_104153/g.300178 Transcript_104153/m.300178 type:complete len:328 (-) Transcript_104153:4236-5219(-)
MFAVEVDRMLAGGGHVHGLGVLLGPPCRCVACDRDCLLVPFSLALLGLVVAPTGAREQEEDAAGDEADHHVRDTRRADTAAIVVASEQRGERRRPGGRHRGRAARDDVRGGARHAGDVVPLGGRAGRGLDLGDERGAVGLDRSEGRAHRALQVRRVCERGLGDRDLHGERHCRGRAQQRARVPPAGKPAGKPAGAGVGNAHVGDVRSVDAADDRGQAGLDGRDIVVGDRAGVEAIHGHGGRYGHSIRGSRSNRRYGRWYWNRHLGGCGGRRGRWRWIRHLGRRGNGRLGGEACLDRRHWVRRPSWRGCRRRDRKLGRHWRRRRGGHW